MATRLNWVGFRQLNRGLREFDGKVQREVSRLAITKAATPVVRQVKKNAQEIKRTGILGRSIGRRIVSYERQVLALVGARRGFQEVDQWGRKQVPAKTGHLPELGFNHPSGKRVHARRWLERGIESTADEFERILYDEMENKFATAVERTAKRFQRQLRRI